MIEKHERKKTDWKEKKINENNNNNETLCVCALALVWFGISFLMAAFGFDLISSFLQHNDPTACMLGVWDLVCLRVSCTFHLDFNGLESSRTLSYVYNL